MGLSTTVDSTPFLACPGPGVPYVLPRLLADAGVRAVISTVPVGRHTGYLTAYFAETGPTDVSPANDWGAAYSAAGVGGGSEGWCATLDDVASFDFDLAPWIASGQVQWTQPGFGLDGDIEGANDAVNDLAEQIAANGLQPGDRFGFVTAAGGECRSGPRCCAATQPACALAASALAADQGDDGMGEAARRGRAKEGRVAEGEDAAIGRDEAVSVARARRGHADDRLVQLLVAGRAQEPRVAEREDAAVTRDEPVALSAGASRPCRRSAGSA